MWSQRVDTEETLHTHTQGVFCPPTHDSSPAPEARCPTHSWPVVLGSWPPGRGHIEFSPHVPCNLSSLETFCRLMFYWAERGRHGDTEEKEGGSICGRKKRTQKGRGPRRLPRTRIEEKPDSEPSASAVPPDIAAHRCKQPCSLCVCVCGVPKTPQIMQ